MNCRHWVLVCCVAFFSATAVAQQQANEKLAALWEKLSKAKQDTARSGVYYEIAKDYFARRSSNKLFLDTALRFYILAEEMAARHKLSLYFRNAIYGQAIMYLFRGENVIGRHKMSLLPDSSQAYILAWVGTLYASEDNKVKKNWDSTLFYFKEQLALSRQIGFPKIEANALVSLAIYNFRLGAFEEGRRFESLAEKLLKQNNQLSDLAIMWEKMGAAMPFLDANFKDKIRLWTLFQSIYRQLKNFEKETAIGIMMSDVYIEQGNLSAALSVLNEVEDVMNARGVQKVYNLYVRYYDIYRMQGDFEKALNYILETVKASEKDNGVNREHAYTRLGITYIELSEFQKGIDAFDRGIEIAKATNKVVPGVMVKFKARALIALGKKKEALAFVQLSEKENNARFSKQDLMALFETYGECYAALGDQVMAETFYLKALEPAKSLEYSWALSPRLSLGKFYFGQGDSMKSRPFLDQLLGFFALAPANVQADIHLMLFKIDSSQQDYLPALAHLNRHKGISDTIYSLKKNRLIAEINTKYEVEKKNNELLLKDQAILLNKKDIELLTREGLLQKLENEKRSRDIIVKEKSIALLRNEAEMQKVLALGRENNLKLKEKTLRLNEKDLLLLKKRTDLQTSELQQAAWVKKISIGGIFLLLIILGLVLNQYRLKKRSSIQMADKNKVLAGLLIEKEWLVKEVHHRVKNNLQVMQSLLESQASYLSDEALAAVRDSQHRVHAMSLIHQKLYQTESHEGIDMKLYIPELIEYLKDS
jgi:two-component sensor histidine kinase